MVLGEVEKLANSNEYKNMGEAAKIGYISGALQAGQAAGYGTTGAAKETAEVNAIESYSAAATVGTKNAAFAGYAKGVNEMNGIFTSFLSSAKGSAAYNKLGAMTNEFLNNSNPIISSIARNLFAQDAAKFTTDTRVFTGNSQHSKSASTDKGFKSSTEVGIKAGVNTSGNLSGKSVGSTVGTVVGGLLGSLVAGGTDVATEGIGIPANVAEVGGGVALGGMVGGEVGGFVQHTWNWYTGSGRKNTNTNTDTLAHNVGNTTAGRFTTLLSNGTNAQGIYDIVSKNSYIDKNGEPLSPGMPSDTK